VLAVGSFTISKDECLNLFSSSMFDLMLTTLNTSLCLQFGFMPRVGFTGLCLMCISLLSISVLLYHFLLIYVVLPVFG